MVPIGLLTVSPYPLLPGIFTISPAAGTVVIEEQLNTVTGLQFAIETPLLAAFAVAVITLFVTRAGLIELSVQIPALTVVEPIKEPSL